MRAWLLFILTISTGGCSAHQEDDLPSGPYEEPPLTIVSAEVPPPEGAEIRGRLVDLQGRPLRDVFLRALDVDRARTPSLTLGRVLGGSMPLALHSLLHSGVRRGLQQGLSPGLTSTNADGEFRFPELSPGAYDVFVLRPNFAHGGTDAGFLGQVKATPLNTTPLHLDGRAVELRVDREFARFQHLNLDPEGASGSSGRLNVTVRFPTGAPYDLDNQVRVIRKSDDVCVARTGRWNHCPWYQVDLAPGRYVVRASANQIVPFCSSGRRPVLAPLGPAECEIEVAVGGTLDVDLTLLRGGRVRVAVPTAKAPAAPLLRAALAVPPPSGANEFHAALLGPGAGTARLVDMDGAVTRLDFHAPRLALSYRFEKLLPGTDCLSHTIVPPGRYRLEVDMPGFEPSSTEIDVRVDEVTAVRVPLIDARDPGQHLQRR